MLFGEVTSTSKSTEFKLVDNVAGSINLEISIDQSLLVKPFDYTDQIFTVSHNSNTGIQLLADKNDAEDYSDTTVTLDDFSVTRAEGTIYIIDIDSIPCEYDEETGEEMIYIGTSGYYNIYSKNNFVEDYEMHYMDNEE